MRCKSCKSEDQRVIDSRADNFRVNRIRVCNKCGNRFKTVEIYKETMEKHLEEEDLLRTILNCEKEMVKEEMRGLPGD